MALHMKTEVVQSFPTTYSLMQAELCLETSIFTSYSWQLKFGKSSGRNFLFYYHKIWPIKVTDLVVIPLPSPPFFKCIIVLQNVVWLWIEDSRISFCLPWLLYLIFNDWAQLMFFFRFKNVNMLYVLLFLTFLNLITLALSAENVPFIISTMFTIDVLIFLLSVY